VFPTQVLARAVPSEGKGVTTVFAEGQELGAYTVFEDISKVTPDFTRELTIAGAFFNDLASKEDSKAFVYAFDGTAFPNVPLLQPRLGSVEEWRFINHNNDGIRSTFTSTTSRSRTISIRPRAWRPGQRCGRSTTPTCLLPSLAPRSRSSSRARSPYA
jgi:hypothetical protein